MSRRAQAAAAHPLIRGRGAIVANRPGTACPHVMEAQA